MEGTEIYNLETLKPGNLWTQSTKDELLKPLVRNPIHQQAPPIQQRFLSDSAVSLLIQNEHLSTAKHMRKFSNMDSKQGKNRTLSK